jgi:hypothetical protein
MKTLVAAFILACLVGCTDTTAFGACVGISDQPNPALLYKPSVRNIVIAIIFSETIIVPVVVIVNQLNCPIGKNEVK